MRIIGQASAWEAQASAGGTGARTVRAFVAASAVVTIAALTATLGLGLGPMSVVGVAVVCVVGGAVAAGLLVAHHPHSRLGLANLVTTVRLGLVAMLVGLLLADVRRPLAVIVIAVVVLVLDGVDGRLARWQGLTSRFGAAYDVEVDSVFALVLAVLAASGPAGPVVLLLGLPHYVFGGAALVAPWLRQPLPERYSRKVVGVVHLVVLIVLQLPWLPSWLAVALALGTTALVVGSFAIDIGRLRRARARGSRSTPLT